MTKLKKYSRVFHENKSRIKNKICLICFQNFIFEKIKFENSSNVFEEFLINFQIKIKTIKIIIMKLQIKDENKNFSLRSYLYKKFT